MATFLLRRVALAVLLVFLVLTLLFFVLRLAPGDPQVFYDNDQLTAAQRQALTQRLGLDQPPIVQYGRWLQSALVGDWGVSFSQKRPVAQILTEALPATLLLTASALFLQYLFGILLGVFSARRAGSVPDHLVRVGSLVLYALPQFWLGLMALLVLSYRLPLFPPGRMHDLDAAGLAPLPYLADLLHHLALPALVLGAGSCGALARYVRNTMLDALEGDYIVAARARGLPEWRVVWVHALRNSLTPLTQLVGLSLPFLLSGALVVEVVFSWPGMGRLVSLAVSDRDYPLILGATALTALVTVAGSLVADVLQAVADPRVRDA